MKKAIQFIKHLAAVSFGMAILIIISSEPFADSILNLIQ